MYHPVDPFSPPARRHGLFCHVDRFQAQLRYLQRSRCNVISLQDAYAGLFCGADLPRKSVVLTFDDGYQDVYDFAWPLLQQYRMPATVFMVAGKMGQKADWLQGADARSTRLMDANTLRTLAANDITIGSHGQTHCHLAGLDRQQRQREIVDSKTMLEDVLGQPVEHFCYPYGSQDQAARDAVQAARYSTGLTTRRDRADRADNAYAIPRQGISYKDSRLHFAFKLNLKHARATRLISRSLKQRQRAQ